MAIDTAVFAPIATDRRTYDERFALSYPSPDNMKQLGSDSQNPQPSGIPAYLLARLSQLEAAGGEIWAGERGKSESVQ
jgi:hypothetical protein